MVKAGHSSEFLFIEQKWNLKRDQILQVTNRNKDS